MIPNQWYAVLDSKELKPGRPLGVTRLGEKMVFWRSDSGAITGLRDACPHRGAALSIGKVADGLITCPFHGFEFDASGRCTLIPAHGRATPVPKAFQAVAYSVREAFGFIWVWWGEPAENLPEIRFFDAIDQRLPHITQHHHWATHYSRAIENQLDVVHLPFVHHNTIGRGLRSVVDGPVYRWGGADFDLLDVWMYNRVDNSAPIQQSDQLPPPARSPSLQFRLPNLWHNWISDQLHLVAVFAPIDAENTLIYIRTYQSMVTTPLLRNVFNLLMTAGNTIILGQDRRVVITQQPKRTDLHMGEKMIAGDGPIIAYRRRRFERQNQ